MRPMPTKYLNYCATVNGIRHEYRLHIIADSAALCACPVCGLPDCGNEQFLWAGLDNEKQAIRFGGDTFGAFLERWQSDDMTAADYQKLPEFIGAHNEGRGWTAAPGPSVVIDAPDFRRALEVIKSSRHSHDSDDFSIRYYPAMTSLVDRVISEHEPLHIIR